MRVFILLFVAMGSCSMTHSQSWNLTGNSGTNPAVDFIGTTDNNALRFRMNNVYAGEIDSATQRTFLGYGAGSHTTGSYNVAIGYNCMYSNTTGISNTAAGMQALYLNTTGRENVAAGNGALYSNTTGNGNTALGSIALYSNASGTANTAIGRLAMYSNTIGYNNVAIGTSAMRENNTGSSNTAAGNGALSFNHTGSGNTAIGAGALIINTTGRFNTVIGSNALASTTSSENNTVLGSGAGSNFNLGWNNTLIGANSTANAGDLYNCIALGKSALCTASNQARIGNASTVSIGGYTNWSRISDGRVKKNIRMDVPGLVFINKLKPITYNLDMGAAGKITGEPVRNEDNSIIAASRLETSPLLQKEQMVYSGFIAQDVEKTARALGYEFSGVDAAKNEKDLYGLRYADFVVPLVKAVQELSEQVDELKKKTARQEKLNKELLKRMEKMESLLSSKK